MAKAAMWSGERDTLLQSEWEDEQALAQAVCDSSRLRGRGRGTVATVAFLGALLGLLWCLAPRSRWPLPPGAANAPSITQLPLQLQKKATVSSAEATEQRNISACKATTWDRFLCLQDEVPCPEYWPEKEFRRFVIAGDPRGGGAGFLPILSSHSLDTVNTNITKVLIFAHGALQNPWTYWAEGRNWTRRHNISQSTLVVAPWFGAVDINGTSWNSDTLSSNDRSFHWQRGRYLWVVGAYSLGGENVPDISSFELIDVVVRQLNNLTLFPNLRDTTLAGFSAGCQMLSRWAFFSDMSLPSDKLPLVKVVAASCGAHMYLEPRRPSPVCSPTEDTGTSHECASFELLAEDSLDEDIYGHGLTNASRFHYIREIAGIADGAAFERRKEEFKTKRVKLMCGRFDTCNCGVDGYANNPTCYKHELMGGKPDVCCSGVPLHYGENDMGSNRLQRLLNYLGHLKELYGSSPFDVGFFDGGHDVFSWFQSDSLTKFIM